MSPVVPQTDAEERTPVPRETHLFHAIEVLTAGGSLDIVGDPGSGRSELLERICEHFTSRQWTVVRVSGTLAFRKVNLSALGLIGASTASIHGALTEITSRVDEGRTIIVVDNWDDVDEASWGILCRVRSHLKTPIVSARLTGGGRERQNASTGFLATYLMQLDPLAPKQLESTLTKETGVAFEPVTLTTIYEKTGGNPSLALALFRSARRAGRIRVEDGVAVATGNLWTESMSPVAEALLRPLTAEQRMGLERMAMLGPVPLSVALKVVERDVLDDLDDREMLEVYSEGDGQVVSLRQPLLVEYFRTQTNSLRRMLVNDDIVTLLSGPDGPVPAENETGQTTMLATLVREHSRRRLLIAKEAWSSSRSKGTAAALLSAMEATGATEDEMMGIFEVSRKLGGTPDGVTAWSTWAVFHCVTLNRPEAALGHLDERLNDPNEPKAWLLAHRVMVLASFYGEDATSTLPDVESLSPDDAWTVQNAGAFVKLVRGQVNEALEILTDIRTRHTNRFTDMMMGLALIANGEFARAIELARRGFDDGKAEFSAASLYEYGYVGALAALLSGRLGDSEEFIADIAPLGVPAGEVMSYQAICAIAEAIAAKRDGASCASLAPLTGARPSGPLPAMQHEWVTAERLKAEQQFEEAGDVLTRLGDRLWDMDLRLAAAYAYLTAAKAHPDPRRLPALEKRVIHVTGRAIKHERLFLIASIRGDVDGMVAGAERLESVGQFTMAMGVWRKAAALFEAQGDSEAAVSATSRADSLAASLRGDCDTESGPVSLTEREREVAHLAVAGLSNPEIAKMLFVSPRTVESHLLRAMKKAGVATRHELGFAFGQRPPERQAARRSAVRAR